MKLRMFACVVLSAVAMFAADVTGKWTATMQTPNGSREVTYNLKADGSKLTGTYAGRQGDREIENGKVDGENVSWEQSMGERKLVYKGKIAGDEIKVSTQFGDQTREVVLKRAK